MKAPWCLNLCLATLALAEPAPLEPSPTRAAGTLPAPELLPEAEPRTSVRPAAEPRPAVSLPVNPQPVAATGAPGSLPVPLDRVRYAAPEGPAPLVGYAPQTQPLPAYPGFPANAAGGPGFPSQVTGAGQLGSLFTDLKASRPGDTLTIVITTKAVAAANAAKSSGREAGVSFDGGAGVFQILPGFGLTYKGDTKGTTNDTSGFNVATTFTVTVKDLAPNGNLLLEGEQVVRLDGRDQWVKVTGECRPYDVLPNNTIDSTRVANVRIDFVGTRATKPRKGLFDVIGSALESLFGIFF